MSHEFMSVYEEQMAQLKGLWHLLRRNLPLILTMVVLGLMAAAWYTTRQPVLYKGCASLIVEGDISRIIELGEEKWNNFDDNYFHTQAQVLLSRQVAGMAFDAMQLNKDSFYATHTDPLKYFIQLSDVTAIAKTHVIQVSTLHPKPEVAAACADALAEAYLRQKQAGRRETSKEAFVWLSEQLSVMKTKVQTSELALLKYKEGEHIVSLEKRQNLLEKRLAEKEDQFAKVGHRALELDAILSELEGHAVDERRAELTELLQSSVVQELKKRLNGARVAHASAATTYRAKHPHMQELAARVTMLEAELDLELDKAVASLRAEARIVEAKKKTLSAELQGLKQQSMRLAKQAVKYGVLQRDAQVNRDMYHSLLARIKEADINGHTTASNTHILDRSGVGRIPVSPNKPQNLIVGLVFGLVIGLGMAFCAEFINDTLIDEKDVSFYLGQATLGMLPHVASGSLEATSLPENFDHELRRLGVAVESYTRRHGVQSLMITSATTGGGKTTVARLLAHTLAEANQKILLVDGDLLNPELTQSMQSERAKGLTCHLVEGSELHELVHPTHHPNLFFLGAGSRRAQPHKLLNSEAMGQYLKQAACYYDLVIIDTPPLDAVPEVTLLASMVDGVLMVARTRKTSRSLIRHFMTVLEETRAEVPGLVLIQSPGKQGWRLPGIEAGRKPAAYPEQAAG